MKTFVLIEHKDGKEIVLGVFSEMKLADKHVKSSPGRFILEFKLNHLKEVINHDQQ